MEQIAGQPFEQEVVDQMLEDSILRGAVPEYSGNSSCWLVNFLTVLLAGEGARTIS
jgi:hypothetical protein